ncbi:C-3',4' desaturase CrtD [Synechococcus sp. CCFWC 502]|uniref:C-3',4' desaturase CrtD n=1 Tax=unclassified Synechococcus TaxID=2626047 RepID=UPI0000699AAE|nr:C-3',4' desaturase CrtD [Synechococcus sp. CCFWC 502]EAQ76746.1 phytoene dehydrogenase related enzyme [Synechococcus sp. WH 5701]WFN59096.1 C-3',4' desaturase CrtD [Synechococcus sp. CCFWC 502]
MPAAPAAQRLAVSPSPTDAPLLDVTVIGGGIAGLSAAALLAREGLSVQLLEAHHQTGGCAGTFRRGAYVFDVGATQVAGLEPGGIHDRLFRHLGVEAPAATPLDPGCVVDLSDGQPPVSLWRDPQRWHQERQRQFPGSERFWSLCAALHGANWSFAGRHPVLPPRSLWDLGQLLGALRPANLASGALALASVADLLRLSGCSSDQRLRRFLDLQLRLYSQEPAEGTAALYGASVLTMAQAPLGLWHLQGSMQALSTSLETALAALGGELRLRHRVTSLQPAQPQGWSVRGQGPGGRPFTRLSRDVVVALPPQALTDLLGEAMPGAYRERISGFPDPSGALVFYGAVERALLPEGCPAHLQIDWADPGSLFVSVSREGDGRAPAGQATVIASVFTPARPWLELEREAYALAKAEAMAQIQNGLELNLGLDATDWRHRELATPRGFARWTGRPFGFVGGLGQHPSRFGPFGLASRTPLPGLWLCGDSIHPGEGTAGVSLSALMASRQLLQARGKDLALP